MRRASLLVVVATMACGGGDAQSGGAKNAKNGAHGNGTDDSIADIASREGLPSLGGSGDRTGGGGGSGSLRLELSDKDNPIKVDGVTKEWTLVTARTVTKGTADQLTFKCGLAYDSNYV
jgi:hypothetical protein